MIDRYAFEIEVTGPFRLDLTVWALRRRPHNAIDRWNSVAYERVLPVQGTAIEIAVSQKAGPKDAVLLVEMHSAETREWKSVEDNVRKVLDRVLGLSVDLSGFYKRIAHDQELAMLANRYHGMRPPRFPSVFEALANAVACQQISLTAGIHILNRLANRFGIAASPSKSERGFPLSETLSMIDIGTLRELGLSRAKAATIGTIAHHVAENSLDLESLSELSQDSAKSVLLDISGVGRWSAEYVLLRGLGHLDVLPCDDVGVRNNIRKYYDLSTSASYDEIKALSRPWYPYAGVAYFHFLLDSLSKLDAIIPNLPQ